jgi:hypothetical protein
MNPQFDEIYIPKNPKLDSTCELALIWDGVDNQYMVFRSGQCVLVTPKRRIAFRCARFILGELMIGKEI